MRTRRHASLRHLVVTLAAGLLCVLAFAPASAAARPQAASDAKLHPFTITSTDFRDGGRLPNSAANNIASAACRGENQAPELRWTNEPSTTQSFAFTMNDPDAPVAGGFHHWVVYNIPASVHELEGHGQNPFSEGTTSFGTTGYGGPCPPPTGQRHHYIFTVYALKVAHVDGDQLTFEQLLQAMGPNVVGATTIVGIFSLPTHP
jgi:Raf kinase inhibitor-like YbhB/YbcL family protein